MLNLKVKQRESFRPFAPAVLRERVNEYFDLDADSPYMLLVAPVTESQRTGAAEERKGFDRLKVVRSKIPAVTHVDYSARIQTVRREENARFYDLISAFEKLTSCPVLVNTSFNIRGEPVVCTPEDAYRCFMGTDMDALVLEHSVLLKREQPASAAVDRERYVGAFQPD